MPKYELEANRYFYHGIYYYLNPPYDVKRKLKSPHGVWKVLKPNMLDYHLLSDSMAI